MTAVEMIEEPLEQTDAVAIAFSSAPKKRIPKTETRIHDEPAFVLHSYPYKETSLIIEAMTRHHGRIALVARGAKRPRSALRGLLQSFQPLTLGWLGGRSKTSELRTLTKAEWVGGLLPLRGDGLLCGFYLNELLLKLLARDDAHESLFDAYVHALAALSHGEHLATALRSFEYALLREAGYALRLTHCIDSEEPIVADGWYRYQAGHGAVRITGKHRSDELVLAGKTLLDIEAGDYSDATTLTQSKLLMRQLLNAHLAGQNLNTRQMMMDLQNL